MLLFNWKSKGKIEMNLKEKVISLVHKYDESKKNNAEFISTARDFFNQHKNDGLHFVLNTDFIGFLFEILYEEGKEDLFCEHFLSDGKYSVSLQNVIYEKIFRLTCMLYNEERKSSNIAEQRLDKLIRYLLNDNIFESVMSGHSIQNAVISFMPVGTMEKNIDFVNDIISRDPVCFYSTFLSKRWNSYSKEDNNKKFFLFNQIKKNDIVPLMEKNARTVLYNEGVDFYNILRKDKNKENLPFLMACKEGNMDLVKQLVNDFGYTPNEKEIEVMQHLLSTKTIIKYELNKFTIKENGFSDYEKLKSFILNKKNKEFEKFIKDLAPENKSLLWQEIKEKPFYKGALSYNKKFRVYEQELGLMAIMSCHLPLITALLKCDYPFTEKNLALLPYVMKNTRHYEIKLWQDFKEQLIRKNLIPRNNLAQDYISSNRMLINEKNKEAEKCILNDVLFNKFFNMEMTQILMNFSGENNYKNAVPKTKYSLPEISPLFRFYLFSHKNHDITNNNLSEEYKSLFVEALRDIMILELERSKYKKDYDEDILTMYKQAIEKTPLLLSKNYDVLNDEIINMTALLTKESMLLDFLDYINIKAQQQLLKSTVIIYNKDKLNNRI